MAFSILIVRIEADRSLFPSGRNSVLATRISILVARISVLVARISVLVARNFVLVDRISILRGPNFVLGGPFSVRVGQISVLARCQSLCNTCRQRVAPGIRLDRERRPMASRRDIGDPLKHLHGRPTLLRFFGLPIFSCRCPQLQRASALASVRTACPPRAIRAR